MSVHLQSLEARTTNKRQEVLRVAQGLFQQSPDWVSFYREVLGLGGVVRQAFTTAEHLAEFEQSDEYAEIQAMLAKLRALPNKEPIKLDETNGESTRVITVRMPKSLHEALKLEAHDRKTSMNKLCISKLLQVIDEDLVPNELDAAGLEQKSA